MVIFFSFWVLLVVVGVDDRMYFNVIIFGDKSVLKGIGFVCKLFYEFVGFLFLGRD